MKGKSILKTKNSTLFEDLLLRNKQISYYFEICKAKTFSVMINILVRDHTSPKITSDEYCHWHKPFLSLFISFVKSVRTRNSRVIKNDAIKALKNNSPNKKVLFVSGKNKGNRDYHTHRHKTI